MRKLTSEQIKAQIEVTRKQHKELQGKLSIFAREL
jgi:hypothetical protein